MSYLKGPLEHAMTVALGNRRTAAKKRQRNRQFNKNIRFSKDVTKQAETN